MDWIARGQQLPNAVMRLTSAAARVEECPLAVALLDVWSPPPTEGVTVPVDVSAIFLETRPEQGHSPDSHITSTEVQNFWNKDPTGSVVANRSCQTVASSDHQASAVQAAVAPAAC